MPAEPATRPSTRERILAAATEVARTDGAGNLSLDAIAARAGVSKGGLLYHFPTKAALLKAVVERFVSDFETDMKQREGSESLLSRYVELTLDEYCDTEPGASGVFAAMAEDPNFLKPIKVFQRRLLDQLMADAADRTRAIMIFLALEGMRSQVLFNLKALTEQEIDAVTQALRRLAREVG